MGNKFPRITPAAAPVGTRAYFTGLNKLLSTGQGAKSGV